MKNKFLEKVAEQIEDERSRKLITAELESHLLDKIDYYVDIGYSKEEAEKRATEEMGNPDDTAVPLNALHNNNFRDLLSFICCGVIILMFFCTIWFRDAFIYSYDNQSYRHSILCDFVSLAFLITYVVMLILARKSTLKSFRYLWRFLLSCNFSPLLFTITTRLHSHQQHRRICFIFTSQQCTQL